MSKKKYVPKRKVLLDCDERYPDYTIKRYTKGYPWGTEVELPIRFIAHFRFIEKEYNRLQDKLIKISAEAKEKA